MLAVWQLFWRRRWKPSRHQPAYSQHHLPKALNLPLRLFLVKLFILCAQSLSLFPCNYTLFLRRYPICVVLGRNDLSTLLCSTERMQDL